jgi:allophanate hydrolase
MGMRLSGPSIGHLRGFDIVSDGIAPGSIQVLGNGQPIVLLADRQTTGGYPKIATVISADLPALSRLAVGAKVAFEPVTLEQAEAARRTFVAEINALHEKLERVPARSADVIPMLLDCNLISGVVDAAA